MRAIVLDRSSERVDLQESVGLGKARDSAGPLAVGKATGPFSAGNESNQHEFLAPELGGDPPGTWPGRARGLRGQPPAPG